MLYMTTNKNTQNVNVKVVVGHDATSTPKKKAPRRRTPKSTDAPIEKSPPLERPYYMSSAYGRPRPQPYAPQTISISNSSGMPVPPYFQVPYTNVEATMNAHREAMKNEIDDLRERMREQATHQGQLNNIEIAINHLGRSVESMLPSTLNVEHSSQSSVAGGMGGVSSGGDDIPPAPRRPASPMEISTTAQDQQPSSMIQGTSIVGTGHTLNPVSSSGSVKKPPKKEEDTNMLSQPSSEIHGTSIVGTGHTLHNVSSPSSSGTNQQPQKKPKLENYDDIEYHPWAYERQKEMLDTLNGNIKKLEKTLKTEKYMTAGERDRLTTTLKEVRDHRDATEEVLSVMSQKKMAQTSQGSVNQPSTSYALNPKPPHNPPPYPPRPTISKDFSAVFPLDRIPSPPVSDSALSSGGSKSSHTRM